MSLTISDITPPENPVVGTQCVIRCTVKNTDAVVRELRVYLKEGSTTIDKEPGVHWQNVDPGEEFAFDGFWNSLKFKPVDIQTYSLKIELHEQSLGKVDTETFELSTIDMPEWWDSLLDGVGLGNVNQITDPVMDLFTGFDIEGWTVPPYTCFICGAKFTGETADDDFSNHLMSHLTAFQEGWF